MLFRGKMRIRGLADTPKMPETMPVNDQEWFVPATTNHKLADLMWYRWQHYVLSVEEGRQLLYASLVHDAIPLCTYDQPSQRNMQVEEANRGKERLMTISGVEGRWPTIHGKTQNSVTLYM